MVLWGVQQNVQRGVGHLGSCWKRTSNKITNSFAKTDVLPFLGGRGTRKKKQNCGKFVWRRRKKLEQGNCRVPGLVGPITIRGWGGKIPWRPLCSKVPSQRPRQALHQPKRTPTHPDAGNKAFSIRRHNNLDLVEDYGELGCPQSGGLGVPLFRPASRVAERRTPSPLLLAAHGPPIRAGRPLWIRNIKIKLYYKLLKKNNINKIKQ